MATAYDKASRSIQIAVVRNSPELIGPTQVADFLSGPQDAAFRIILEKAIKAELINPDVALAAIIKNVKGRLSIYSVSIVLRLGANANSYITDPEVQGHIHILAYLYFRWKKNGVKDGAPCLNTIVLLLIHAQATPVKAVFDSSGGTIRPYTEMKKEKTVIEWLDENGYENILKSAYPSLNSNIDGRTRDLIGVLSGDRDLILEQQLPEEMIERIVMARTETLLPLAVRPKTRSGLDYLVVYWAVENFSSEAFSYYLSLGVDISYPFMNSLILMLKYHSQRENEILRAVFVQMIEVAITTGTTIDINQRLLMGDADGRVQSDIMKLYSRPYWEKVCTRSDMIDGFPQRLTRASVLLGIDQGSNVCRELKEIATSDPVSVQESIVRRQQSRLNAHHGKISEYSNGRSPSLRCMNVSGENYMTYPDLNIASYRDINEDVWCFLSPDYRYILESGTNVVNGVKVPGYLKDEIQAKERKLKELNVDPRSPKSVSQVLAEIMEDDKLDDEHSEKVVNQLFDRLLERGISKTEVQRLTPQQLESVVSQSGYRAMIRDLTPEHAITTVAYIVNSYSAVDSAKEQLIISKLSSTVGGQRKEVQTNNTRMRSPSTK